MDNINILLSLVILINLMLVVVSYSGNKNNIDKGVPYSVYLLKITTIVWWTGSLIFFRIAHNDNVNFMSKNLYVSASLIASSFYYFSLIFPDFKKQYRKKLILAMLANGLLILLIIKTGIVIIGGEVKDTIENIILFGPGQFIFAVYVLYFMCTGFFNIYIKYKKEEDQYKKAQLLYLFIGYTLSSFVAYITNLILPAVNNFEYMWIGPTATVCMLVAITYAVTRHHLFNIKIITTDLFVFILWVFTLIKIAAFEQSETVITFNQALIHISFLIASIIVGILLIKSVKKQAEQHEENKKLLNELNLANKQLQEVDDIKSKFVALARHQMASPLTAITAYASLLNDKDIDLDKIGLKSLQGIIERFIVIVKDFLAISQIENNELNYSNDEIDLAQIINNVLCERRFIIDHQNINIDLDINNKQNYNIKGDKIKLTTAIANILENSIQYSKNSSIRINLDKEDLNIILTVRDTGIRDLPEISPLLLRKFSPEGNSFEATLMGNGLGVYVAKRFIEAHGGILKIKHNTLKNFCEFNMILFNHDHPPHNNSQYH